jgi:hypothetical protein
MDNTLLIEKCLSYLPMKLDYHTWLTVVSAVANELPESTAHYLLTSYFPDTIPGETLSKIEHRLKDVKIGALINLAKQYSFNYGGYLKENEILHHFQLPSPHHPKPSLKAGIERAEYERAEYMEFEEAVGYYANRFGVDYDTAFEAVPSQRLFTVAVNNQIYDKNCDINGNPNKDFMKCSNYFRNEQLTIEAIIDTICKGHSIIFCEMAANNDGYCIRKSESFIKSDLFAIDIDGGMSIEEALNHDLTKMTCLLLYTTCSHTADKPRFRIVFSIQNKILTKEAYIGLLNFYIKAFGSDKSCKDPCRIFYGNRKAKSFKL